MEEPATIYSDDEIEPEIDGEEETLPSASKSKTNKSRNQPMEDEPEMEIKFDTGELLDLGMSSKFKKAAIVESNLLKKLQETSGEDNIREMGNMDQRVARSIQKQAKGSKKHLKKEEELMLKNNPSGMSEQEESTFFDTIISANAPASTSTGQVMESEERLMFSQLHLSRALLRAVERIGYVTPTPIQEKVIPYALAGRDICASAVTGSGKTAAFALPFLERLLLYRAGSGNTGSNANNNNYKKVSTNHNNAIRVLVITPTRELAMQIHDVVQKLITYIADISCLMICGGQRDVRQQEAILRGGNLPEVIICTPGRMLDHLRNAPGVNVDSLDVLVLDEVDKLLDMGFQEEVEALISMMPTSRTRQTLLFSATMTPKIEDLMKLSLKQPIRIKMNAKNTSLAPRLIQEFVRNRGDESLLAMIPGGAAALAAGMKKAAGGKQEKKQKQGEKQQGKKGKAAAEEEDDDDDEDEEDKDDADDEDNEEDEEEEDEEDEDGEDEEEPRNQPHKHSSKHMNKLNSKKQNNNKQAQEEEPQQSSHHVTALSGSLSTYAICLSLICRYYYEKTIIFFELKKDCKEFVALLNMIFQDRLDDLDSNNDSVDSNIARKDRSLMRKAVELHGDLPQPQRYEALHLFKSGQAGVLVCTDVAARGLDIPGVQTVINAQMPRQLNNYIHRVGRTARAGSAGRSITLVTDDRRKMLKEVLKEEANKLANNSSNSTILTRNIPPPILKQYTSLIYSLTTRLQEYKTELYTINSLQKLEREAERAENLIKYRDEIQAHPARTWFQSKAEKESIRVASKQRALHQHGDDDDGGEEGQGADGGDGKGSDQKAAKKQKQAQQAAVDKQGSKKRGRSGSADREDDGDIPALTQVDLYKAKLQKMMSSDDYRILEEDMTKTERKQVLVHRMSRKKKRRQEALQASQAADDEEAAGKGGGGGETVLTEGKLKSIAKKAKQSIQEKALQDRTQLSAGERMMKKITIYEEQKSAKKMGLGHDDDGNYGDGDDGGDDGKPKKMTKRVKIVRPKRSVGGLDLSASEWNSGSASSAANKTSKSSNKQYEKLQRELAEFKEFDPNKRLRKGGKMGNASFKSKKRYKRK